MKCPSCVRCAPPASFPLLGYDATAADTQTFVGLGYGPLTPPPLDWTFPRATAFAIRDSVLSQTDASQQAFAAATAQAKSEWTPPGGTLPIQWENEAENQFDMDFGSLGAPPII